MREKMSGPSIVGFGSRPLVYASGATADWPVVALLADVDEEVRREVIARSWIE